MTVRLEAGNAQIPLWAAIVVVVAILTAGGGILYGAVAKGADAEHKVFAAALAEETKQIEQLVSVNRTQDTTDWQLREAVIRIEEQSKATLAAIGRIERKLGWR